MPRFEPTCIPIIHLAIKMTDEEDTHNLAKDKPAAGNLLSRFEFRGNQADFVDSRAAHNVDGSGDIFKEHFVVTLYESDLFRALLENFLHARPETVPAGIFVVNFDFSVFGYLDDDCLILKILILLLVRIGL